MINAVLVLVFLIQKQRITQSAQPPITRPKVDLRRKAKVSPVSSAGVPEKAIKAVIVYTHDRAAAERLLQNYSQTHCHEGWDGVVDQVIRDLVRDRH
ncbi:MAG: hypothetical protein DCF17_21830 [Shackletoniella antarctica]|jgi:hypothetical protein|uniref:Uncharacterized protein n=1 Tax=Shackletoniella antarctica TaxID=268115 RepID=A0A2W4VL14_9CYAN|nr:MAG: hypothetical protein DCF17_21830 [Shackletoniella antarctica]